MLATVVRLWQVFKWSEWSGGTMQSWQVQQAKARFSDLLRDAVRTGPQQITVRGKPAAVVLSAEAYERLRGKKPSLVDFLRASPWAGLDLDIERDRSAGRDIDL
jgi:prevent-host-death family protein